MTEIAWWVRVTNRNFKKEMSSIAPHKMINFYLNLFVTANAGRNRLTAVWPLRRMFKARKVI